MSQQISLVRRPLRLIAVSCALATAATTAACAPGQSAPSVNAPGQSAPSVNAPVSAAPGTLIMIIRHGEKPSGANATAGIDPAGKPDKHSLTPIGWNRARALVGLFDPKQGSMRPGLARPTVIYAAGGADGEGTRPRETVQPLAKDLDIPENTSFARGQETALIRQAASQPGPTLISWQHGEIPAIAAAFGTVTPTPPASWPANRFDMVWTFTATDHGWAFAQVPEMVLPGDIPAVFP
jgi:hypothetical protein